MSTPLHSKQTIADGIHSAVSYAFVTSASLASATGFDVYDTYKLALVTGDDSLWLLTDPLASPPTWVNVSSQLISGTVSNILGAGGSTVTFAGSVATVSSSAPQVQRLVGQGSTVITQVGTTWFVSSSGGAGGGLTFAGQGGTTVSTLDSSSYTISSSIPQVQAVLGAGGISVTQAGTNWIVSGTAGIGGIFGQGGTAVTSNAGGDYFISSSVPQVQAVLGTGSVSVTQVGTNWIVSGSGGLFNGLFGAGGTTVTSNVGGDYTVSSSAPVVENIAGQGPIAVTRVGTTWFVSSSAGSVTGIFGQGGTTVTPSGTDYIISSSAPPSGLFGQGGTGVTSSGTDFFFSSSVGADAFGNFALVTASPTVTRGRVLTAGTGITLTDAGAGSTLTIASTATGGGGTAPFLTASYPGITGSSIVWKVANYTLTLSDDFIGVGTTVANLTMSLPAASTAKGKIYYIADMAGSASINPFMVKPAGSDTIDSTTGSYVSYANFGTYRIIGLGDTWKSI